VSDEREILHLRRQINRLACLVEGMLARERQRSMAAPVLDEQAEAADVRVATFIKGDPETEH
jgi:hypothetical protein